MFAPMFLAKAMIGAHSLPGSTEMVFFAFEAPNLFNLRNSTPTPPRPFQANGTSIIYPMQFLLMHSDKPMRAYPNTDHFKTETFLEHN
jgi:hypothetical protein